MPLYISKSHYEFHKHTQVIIDLQHCYGGGDFSLDRPEASPSFPGRASLPTPNGPISSTAASAHNPMNPKGIAGTPALQD